MEIELTRNVPRRLRFMSHHHDPHRNPESLLTPAMRGVLDRMRRANHVPLHAMSGAQARAAYAAGAQVLELPVQKLARVENLTVPARDGYAVPVRLYAPSAKVLPVLVYFHGGGFTVGSTDTHDGLCRRLSHLAHCAVVSVDYRLAPEHQFPTAHQDAWDVVQALAGQGAKLGLDTRRLALGGDSAGGTLAAACAIEARNHGLPLALQLLFYPGCAGHQNTASHHRFAKGFALEKTHIDFFFDHYVRTPADRDDWRFAPLDGLGPDGLVVDLVGVAPAWFGLAECDPLVDEGVLFADRLRMAGVAVDLEIYRGVVHEFIKMGRAIPEALTAHADAARALRAAFGVD
jgi:acetyl esterase